MKKTLKTRIAATAMALIMVVALSATAFADGPQGGPQMGGMQQQMNGGPQGGMQMPQGGFDQGAPQGSFGQDQQGAPQMGGMQGSPSQGNFGQDQQMGGFNQNGPMNGQQPPEKPDGEDITPPDGLQPPEKLEGDEDRTPPADGQNGPMGPGGMDPMNQIISAVHELENEDAKANIESLMKAHLDAMEAERNAEDDDARAEAAEAVAAAQEALDEALAAAGIEVSMDQQPPEKPDGEDMTPPEKPEGEAPPANGQQPPEKPDSEDMTPPEINEDKADMFNLFQQFLEWLKGNNAE